MSTPLDPAKAERLLKSCRNGYPLAAARARAGLSKAQVKAAGPELAAEIEEACEEGRAIIAATLIERGLDPKLRDNGALRAGLEMMNGEAEAGIVGTLNRASEPAMEALIRRLDPATVERLARVVGGPATTSLTSFLASCGEDDDDDLPPVPTDFAAAAPLPPRNQGVSVEAGPITQQPEAQIQDSAPLEIDQPPPADQLKRWRALEARRQAGDTTPDMLVEHSRLRRELLAHHQPQEPAA